MTSRIIAVDLDDVLASSAEDFIAYSNRRWGTSLTAADYTEQWTKMWQIDEAELKERSKHIYSSGMQRHFRHIETAKPVLQELAKNFKLVIVTSRVRQVAGITQAWVEQHFAGIFAELNFAGIWDDGSKMDVALNTSKAGVLRKIGAEYLIDDQPKHCFGAAQAGIKAVLFGDYAWNRDVHLIPGITRAMSWPEVKEFFDHEKNTSKL